MTTTTLIRLHRWVCSQLQWMTHWTFAPSRLFYENSRLQFPTRVANSKIKGNKYSYFQKRKLGGASYGYSRECISCLKLWLHIYVCAVWLKHFLPHQHIWYEVISYHIISYHVQHDVFSYHAACHFCSPHNEVVYIGYRFHSVRSSVCLSVQHAVSTLWPVAYFMDYMNIWDKYDA